MKPPSILIIDDEPLMRLSMMDALKAVGYEVHAAATGHEGLTTLKKGVFEIVITDLRLPGADGLDILQACKQRSPRTEVIVITAHGSVETAVEALKIGAYDYLTKPFSLEELLLIVDRVTKALTLRQENLLLREELEGLFSFEGILGKNERMRELVEQIKRVSATGSPVLITGEPGTGKDLVANAIHRNSLRRDQALVKVRCPDFSDALLEAELFGHEKGAFPGAVRQRRGRLELAHKGTLFLDEIGTLLEMIQVKLLRVLQDRQFERVGGNETIEVDVRLVCTTRQELKTVVQQGRFGESLYARLNEMTVHLPPLRERREDILVIAEHLLQTKPACTTKSFQGFSQDARELLLHYSFPGNARELEQIMERAIALGRQNEEIQPWDVCGFLSCPYLGGQPQDGCGFCCEGLTGKGHPARRSDSLSAAREQFERQYILSILDRVGGDRSEAANILGLSRNALQEKCKRYEIFKEEPEQDEP